MVVGCAYARPTPRYSKPRAFMRAPSSRFLVSTTTGRRMMRRIRSKSSVRNSGQPVPTTSASTRAISKYRPVGGGGTARAIARAYSVFATDGRELTLRPETLRMLSAPAVPPTLGFYDECMMGDGVQFSLGFMKHCPVWAFGSVESFGQPGTGGSLGFADPKAGICYAYVTSKMGTALTGDPRELALRNALYAVVPSLPSTQQGHSTDGAAGLR